MQNKQILKCITSKKISSETLLFWENKEKKNLHFLILKISVRNMGKKPYTLNK